MHSSELQRFSLGNVILHKGPCNNRVLIAGIRHRVRPQCSIDLPEGSRPMEVFHPSPKPSSLNEYDTFFIAVLKFECHLRIII